MEVKTYGITQVKDAYHQLTAVIIEYPSAVKTPEKEVYAIRDYDTWDLREDFNRRPFSDMEISCVYTNDRPAVKKDKLSIPGRFVVVELKAIKGAVQEDGILKPPSSGGICTWRKQGDRHDWRRKDFSKLALIQLETVYLENGQNVKSCILPELEWSHITNLELDDAVCQDFLLSTGHSLHCEYWLPKDYEKETVNYPLIINISGGGGQYSSEQQHDPTGGHVSRDRGAVAWLGAKEKVLIFSPQLNRDDQTSPDEIMEAVYSFIEKHRVDTERIIGIGSSLGTIKFSQILNNPEYAKLFTTYIQCNGDFRSAQCMFTCDERRMEEKYGYNCLEDYLNKDIWIEKDNYFNTPEFAEAAASLEGVVNNNVAVWVWHGVNDEVAPTSRGVSAYLMLQEAYRRHGYSEAAINKMVKLTLIQTEEYHNMGIFSYHQASKIAVSHQELLDWALEQKKSDLSRLK